MNVHTIVTQYAENTFGLHSPQVPELFAGSDSMQDYNDEGIIALLSEVGLTSDYTLIRHRQVYRERSGREWYVRVCNDRDLETRRQRIDTVKAVEELLDSTPAPIDSAHKMGTGEALFIVCTHEDTIGWVEEQLDEASVGTIITAVPGGLWTIDVGKVSQEGAVAVTSDTTVGDVLERFAGVKSAPAKDFLTEEATPPHAHAKELLLV